MTVMENIVPKKVNIKFTAKGLRADSNTEARETGSYLTKKSELKVKVKLPAFSKKRKSELVLDVPKEKRCKMDRSVKLQCGVILKALMTQPGAWVFSTPVDPVALKIPDYFSIISHPMDLGTIKSKLEHNIYFSAEEFAADICLTFSNAMLYNPPDNPVHHMAKEFYGLFKRRWKFQLASWNHQTKSVGIIQNGSGMNAQDTQKVCYKESLPDASFVAKNSAALDKKHELRKEVMEMLRSLKRPEMKQDIVQKFNLKEGEIGLNIAALDVSALKELKTFLNASSCKLMPAKKSKNGLHLLSGKVVRKGACVLVNSNPPVSSISSLCDICRGTTCQCGHQKKKVPASSNASEISLEDGCHAAKAKSQDSEVKVSLTHASVSDRDSDGSGSVLDDDNTSTSRGLPAPATTAGAGEGCSPLMDDQALKKALRAAMLKSRFADTIMKASGDKADPGKMHQERERLERLQREEAAKIEAQLKEEQLKLKMQREKERQAARIALQKMQRTVELEDNIKALRELEMLCQRSSSDFLFAFGVGVGREKEIARVRRPLELLGLYLKEDYMDEEEEEAYLNGDREEGEIIQ